MNESHLGPVCSDIGTTLKIALCDIEATEFCPTLSALSKEENFQNHVEIVIGRLIVDYSALFCPMPGWEQSHEASLKGFSDRIQGIYRNCFGQWLSDTSNPRVDPTQLKEDDWKDYSDLSPDFINRLREYKPNPGELAISQACSQRLGTKALPDNYGFYLALLGRKAYHEMLTTCLGDTLLGLKLMSKFQQTEISGPLAIDSEISRVIQIVAGSFCTLYHLAYNSPVLGIHLKWLLAVSSKEKHTLNFASNMGLIHQAIETQIDKPEGLAQSVAANKFETQKGKKRSADQMDPLQENSG